MEQRGHRSWVALAALASAASGCGLIAGFESITGNPIDTAGTGGSAAASSVGATTGGTSSSSGSPVASYKCAWAKGFEGTGTQEFGGLAVDAKGDVWITGSYRGTMTVGEDTLSGGVSPDDSDVFVIKLNGEDGESPFHKGYGDDGEQRGESIAARGEGVFVAGTSRGTLDFGCPTGKLENVEYTNIFMAALEEGQGCTSQAGVYDYFIDHLHPQAVVDGASMLLAGTHNQSIGVDLFLQNNGSTLQPDTAVPQKMYPQPKTATLVPRTAFAAGGQLFVAGEYAGPVMLSGPTGSALEGEGELNAFIAAYDEKLFGAEPSRWSAGYGAAGAQTILAMTGDQKERLFVTGAFEGTLGFLSDAPPLTANAGKDVFVAALAASDGKGAWQVSFGGAEDQAGTAVAYDAAGHAVLVAGDFKGPLKIGDIQLNNTDTSTHIFFARLTEGGAPTFAARFGASGAQHVGAMAVVNGSVFLAGTYRGALDFGCAAGPLPDDHQDTVFVAKLQPEGL